MNKKKLFLFIIMFLIISFSNVSAKDNFLTCEYLKTAGGQTSIDPQISVLCNIYSKKGLFGGISYSHECFVEVNNGTASTKSKKYSLNNWKNEVVFDWNIKDYIVKNSKCPSYLTVYNAKNKLLWAAPTYEEASELKEKVFKGKTEGIFIVPNLDLTSPSDNEILEIKKMIEERTKEINDFLNDKTLEENSTINEYKALLDSLSNKIRNYSNEINQYINSNYFKETDEVIQNFHNAVKNFVAKAYEYENKVVPDEKKDDCSLYTFDECVGKTDSSGSTCIKDMDNKVCKKKRTCTDYFNELNICPTESDYGRTCVLNDSGTACEDKGTTFVCTDYKTKEMCHTKDEKGNRCYWDEEKGCSFLEQEETTPELKCSNIFNTEPGHFGYYLKGIYNLMKFAVPIIILVFAIVDFIKATAAQDQAELKKAANKLVKRLIIGVLIFVLPTILEFALKMAGVEFGTCGIGYK